MTRFPERRSSHSDAITLAAAEALVKDWPEITPAQAKRVAALLRSDRLVQA